MDWAGGNWERQQVERERCRRGLEQPHKMRVCIVACAPHTNSSRSRRAVMRDASRRLSSGTTDVATSGSSGASSAKARALLPPLPPIAERAVPPASRGAAVQRGRPR